MDQSIWDLMSHGGGAMWVVVAFSVIALAVAHRAGDRAVEVRHARAGARRHRHALPRARRGRRGPLRLRALAVADRRRVPRRLRAARPREARARRDRGPPRAPARQPGPARRGCGCSARSARPSPFVGLFGTVVGIMTAMGGFKADDEVKFSMVSGPISEALDRHRRRHPRRRRGRHPVQLLQPAREPHRDRDEAPDRRVPRAAARAAGRLAAEPRKKPRRRPTERRTTTSDKAAHEKGMAMAIGKLPDDDGGVDDEGGGDRSSPRSTSRRSPTSSS